MDVRSTEQERHSKPHASWSGQSRARVKGKDQMIKEGQHNISGRPLQPGPDIQKQGISARQHEITESRDALATQELQGS